LTAFIVPAADELSSGAPWWLMHTMPRIKLALVGLGKITHDQHLPAIRGNENFELVAAASLVGESCGVPTFNNIRSMLSAVPDIEAISICTPPQARYDIARHALDTGRHVLLEKPPAATLSEAQALVENAARRHVALFATWHSRQAAAVPFAEEWLRHRVLHSVSVAWKEDVRVWHPGQLWIRKAGGMGVFDPGINVLSILTRILPQPLLLQEAQLVFPANWETPVAASLVFTDPNGADIRVELDFRQTGTQSKDIDVRTDAGRLQLSGGGSVMHVNGAPVVVGTNREYPNLYERFATLVRQRDIDVDLAPLRLVADGFVRGRRVSAEPFD
jgi:predicted dehydrogenase